MNNTIIKYRLSFTFILSLALNSLSCFALEFNDASFKDWKCKVQNFRERLSANRNKEVTSENSVARENLKLIGIEGLSLDKVLEFSIVPEKLMASDVPYILNFVKNKDKTKTIESSIPINKIYGCLLPHSSIAEAYSCEEKNIFISGQMESLPSSIPPSIPIIDKPDKQFLIAYNLDKIGLHNKAWKIYVEAIYCKYGIPGLTSSGRNSSLSFRAAYYWLKAAKAAFADNKKREGLSFLTRAAIFGDKETCFEAQEIYKMLMMTSGNPYKVVFLSKSICRRRFRCDKFGKRVFTSRLHKTNLDQVIRENSLTHIVNSYIELNFHLRAIDLVKDHHGYLKNFSTNSIRSEWRKIITKRAKILELKKITMWDKEVYPEDKSSEIETIWPFSDFAINKTKEFLKEQYDIIRYPATRSTPEPKGQ